MVPELPSGRQVELAWGDQRVVVTEVGGGLRSYTVGGRPVLDGYGAGEMGSGGRGQVLAPWPNRLAGGRYRFGDDELQLPFEPGRGSAMHGLVRWANWKVLDHEPDRAVVGLILHPQPGYPFTLELAVEYRLDASGLSVTCTATNIGRQSLPLGLGFHPYLTVGTDTIDQAFLHVPAADRLEVDARGIPSGEMWAVEGTALDFRSPRPIGGLRLDACFTSLDHDDDGRSQVVFSAPGGGRVASVWMDRSLPYVMIFTGDTLAPERRRRGLAIEPMTCAPDAYHNGLGLQMLEPEAAVQCTWGIQAVQRDEGDTVTAQDDPTVGSGFGRW